MKFKSIISYLFLSLFFLFAFSCSSSSSETDEPTNTTTSNVGNHEKLTVKTLADRTVRIYWGFDNQWHKLTNSADWPKWNYVRENLTGFYTNFIDMWNMAFQNSKSAEETCSALYNTFKNKYCFFETSMETAVNAAATGYNNAISDKRSLDYLTNAGFNVDYTSLNYMTVADKTNCQSRISLLQSYDGTRKCFYLCGPWCFNGNITNDDSAVEMSKWGDGIETDGPLGYWYANQGSMKECSYSIVKYMAKLNKVAAIMLAPYDAGVSGYSAPANFLGVSKDCVLSHEDNKAAPDIWTLWMYGSGGLELFPESTTNASGETTPSNSATGVAFWLIKHMNEFPSLTLSTETKTTYGINNSGNTYNITIEKGKTIQLPIVINNSNCPQIELAPVIRAALDSQNSNWQITFKINGKDVSEDMIFNGGLNFISSYRLSKTRSITLTAELTPLKSSVNTTIDFEVMSNLVNTTNKKILMTLNLNSK